MNFFTLFLASSITSFLFLTFVSSNVGIFSNVSHSFSAAFTSGFSKCLRHRSKCVRRTLPQLSNHQNFPLWARLPAHLLQEDPVIFVFKQTLQFLSFGKCVLARNPVPLLFAAPLEVHDMEVSALFCMGFPGSVSEVPSSTKFSLNSCSLSGK